MPNLFWKDFIPDQKLNDLSNDTDAVVKLYIGT